MATPSLAEAEEQLHRVREHVEELRRVGRVEDADAVNFVRDLAEQALAGHRSAPPRDLLTTGAVGLALGISDQTVRNWVAAGRLPAVKRGVRTMIPREAVVEEIERSRLRPSEQPAPTAKEEAHLTWRRELLAALPGDIVAQLDKLHDKSEDGQELSAEERAEMARLEREMTNAAARHLEGIIRRGPTGAA